MSELLKLTNEDGDAVYIHPSQIKEMAGNPKFHCTNIVTLTRIHFVSETPEQIMELIEGKAEAPAPEPYEDEALRQKALTEITDLRARLSKAYGDPDYYEWTRYVIALLTS